MLRLSSTLALLSSLQQVIFCTAATPSPVSLNFGTEFYGTDGFWSVAQIRVGTPQQYLWALPNTVGSETWVIGPGGCDDTLACQQSRGGLFRSGESSTYESLGRYELGYDLPGLAADYGDYGLDNITITDTIAAPEQVVAVINDTTIWLGQLGLSVRESRFSNTTNLDYLPLISTLVRNESVIPSHSYGYTAGAHYQVKGVPGSLVLGGVDTTRFLSTNTTFTLSPNYLPKVAIQGITVSSSQSQGEFALPTNWNSSPLKLMDQPQAELFTIDTSTPYLWLPTDVCNAFASALNLTYNHTLDLYVFSNDSNSSSSAQSLQDWNLSFTFTLADSADSTANVQIPITYNAFNLQLSYGFPNLGIENGDPGVNYFPLRRANSSTQYTIGRAFLQETYIMVDYERNIFTLSPAVFPDINTVVPRLVAITRPSASTWPGPSSSSLSTGAKAGIGVGVAVVVLTISAAVFLLIRRRKKTRGTEKKGFGMRWWKFSKSSEQAAVSKEPVSELTGDRRHPRELLVDSFNTRFELPGANPIEMPAGDVPEVYLSTNQGAEARATGANEGLGDGILANHASIRKDYNIRASVAERSSSPAPPYSPSEIGRSSNTNTTTSAGVSPLESRLITGFGSHSSSGDAISPIARQGTHTQSDTNVSPVSPEMGTFQTMSSAGTSSGTNNSQQNSVEAAPSDQASRSLSRNSRFREELTDNPTPTSETQGEQPQLRPRFSWEE